MCSGGHFFRLPLLLPGDFDTLALCLLGGDPFVSCLFLQFAQALAFGFLFCLLFLALAFDLSGPSGDGSGFGLLSGCLFIGPLLCDSLLFGTLSLPFGSGLFLQLSGSTLCSEAVLGGDPLLFRLSGSSSTFGCDGLLAFGFACFFLGDPLPLFLLLFFRCLQKFIL